METRLISMPWNQVEGDALVALAFEKEEGESAPSPGMAEAWIADLRPSGEFKGKILETALLHRPAGLKTARLLVVGAGKASKFGVKEVEVRVKGPGAGRESAVTALQANGLNVKAIEDVTPLPHNGCRPPKKRRV